MGSKHFGDAQHDTERILALVRSAINLGEGVSVVIPPQEKGRYPAQIHWGDAAFAGERAAMLNDEPARPYQTVLDVIRWYDALMGATHIEEADDFQRRLLDAVKALRDDIRGTSDG